jgi:hypothetical protein
MTIRQMLAVLIASVLIASGSVYAEPPQDVFDEKAYSAYMQKTINELNGLYAKANDKNIPQGEAEVARQAAFIKAREALQYIDSRFDKMDVKEGAQLSNTEMFTALHVLTMTMELVAAEHIPHKDRWSYTD